MKRKSAATKCVDNAEAFVNELYAKANTTRKRDLVIAFCAGALYQQGQTVRYVSATTRLLHKIISGAKA